MQDIEMQSLPRRFIGRLMDALVADKIAEPKRIYVSGFSNGALLTYGLMCSMPELTTI